jgi:uncharacterized membrane protein
LSFETARKIGLIASIINVTVPIIAVIVYLSLIALLFTSFASFGSTMPNPSSFIGGIIALYGVIGILGLLSFVGLVLFIIAMYQLSRYYNEPNIFNNILYALIISIIGGAVVIATYFAFIISLITNFAVTQQPPTFFTQLIAILIMATVALSIGIINGILHMRAFNRLAEKSGVDSFRTTGLLYIIGSLLSVVGVGFIIVWIAWIFALMGFNRLRPASPHVISAQQSSIHMAQTKFCPNCRTENLPNALYCKFCATPI